MIRINKWWHEFENAGSRKLVTIRHFNCPSGNDSRGYRKLMREGAAGVMALGVFQSLAQCLAGLGKRARESGEFTNSDGSVLDLDDIIDLTRLPGDVLADAIRLLAEIGWLTLMLPAISQQSPSDLPSSPSDLPSSPNDPPPISQDTPNGEERRGEERRGGFTLSDASDGGGAEPWAKFWEAYPESGRKRSSREKTRKAWAATKPPTGALMALDLWKADRQWTREGGQYVPAADRWLREKRWQDPPTGKPAPSPRRAGGTEKTPEHYENLTEKDDDDNF